MPAPSTPRAVAPPRPGELREVGHAGSSLFGDDALVSNQQTSQLALDHHSVEFSEWVESRADGGTLADSTWYRPTWRDLVWTGVDAANSRVDEGSLTRLRIEHSRLTGLIWTGSTLTDVSFVDCVLDLSALRQTTMIRVRFERCRIKGADFSMSKFTDVLFDACDLSGAEFHQATVVARTRVQGSELAGWQGLARLSGVTVQPTDLTAFAGQLAAELGIIVEW